MVVVSHQPLLHFNQVHRLAVHSQTIHAAQEGAERVRAFPAVCCSGATFRGTGAILRKQTSHKRVNAVQMRQDNVHFTTEEELASHWYKKRGIGVNKGPIISVHSDAQMSLSGNHLHRVPLAITQS